MKMQEISRFSSSGKTFFFNKGRSSNGEDFLSVNALFGKGDMQRLVLFPSQMLSFRQHLMKAITDITGAHFDAPPAPTEPPQLALSDRCPICKTGCGDYRVMVFEGSAGQAWHVRCDACGTIIVQTY